MPKPPSSPGSALNGDETVTLALPGPLFAGRYALLRRIGRGGMGTVYQARDSLVGDMVALKVLELGGDAGPDALERFRREVRLARRITHPHVARMHDLSTHEGQSFLTMEFVEGEDLRALLARERSLSASRAARIALAVCEGLAAAHAAGVVHRDLKPANILVDKGGRVVLTDFGIARAVAGEAASRTLSIVGTPLYMAPEQVAGEPVDARADLYAVGLLLYEMLTGEVPFSGDTPWAAALARLRQPPPDLRQRADVPAPLSELVRRCLGRALEERPASALEMAGALRDWLVSVGEPPLPVPPAPGPAVANATPPPLAATLASGMTPSTPTPPEVKQGVAFLPLCFQGPRESEYLGDSLTGALIDQLSRVRGLRVPGGGVMARFRDERDPRTVGRELGVELVVDGTVQCAGSMVRISVRLLEAQAGTQLWSGRFEYGSTDVFELQDWLVTRVAEEVRGELVLAAWRTRTPPEALTLYRQAAAHVHEPFWNGPGSPLLLLESCLELAPDFLPAISLHAVASLRAWFVSSRSVERDWATAARASVERALRLAPELAPTHLARAMLAAQQDDWRAAVVALRTSLDIAPSYAASLQYLGMLQCEAGRAEEGLPRLRLAYELAPNNVVALFELARCSALRGKMDDYRWVIERLSASAQYRRFGAISLRVRVAAWVGDLEELRWCRAALVDEPELLSRVSGHYADVVLGQVDALSQREWFEQMLAQVSSPRFTSLLCQLATEMLGLVGHAELALTYFQRAADTALIDLEWIDRCPALEPLRALPGFSEGRRKVLARVEAIWNA
jgi:serine/threonine-protein kinase